MHNIIMNNAKLPVRAFLLHITHYDPAWYKNKKKEKPFDLDLGLKIIDLLVKYDINMLIVDCEDGVKYASHPELKRHYSVPMNTLVKIANYAAEKGLEFVPKINFSRSHFHTHNEWLRPHTHQYFDTPEYWKIAFEIINEIIKETKPKRFFHIGMDEDHDRAYSQYVAAVLTLYNELKKNNLRPIIWNDTVLCGSALIHAEKSLSAEDKIPKDIVQILWDYSDVQPEILARIINKGFETWVAPGWDAQRVAEWKSNVLRLGGKGMVMATWLPCTKKYKDQQFKTIETLGPIFKAIP